MSVTLRQLIRLSIRGILFGVFVVVFAACGGDKGATSLSIGVGAVAGGMRLPTPVNQPVQLILLRVDQQVIALDSLLLTSDANVDAPVMNRYAAGTAFTVLAPSGNYGVYPVVTVDSSADEEIYWYRLRAPDGLVGWAQTEKLQPMAETQ